MKSKLTLSDGVVTLRPLVREDIEMLRKWRNQESIRNSFVFNDKITSEQQAQWFEKYDADDTDCMFIALYEDEPVGASALYNISREDNSAEFGRLMLGDVKRRGLGLGRRFTQLTAQMGFDVLNLRRIYLEVFEENAYALKIYEGLGYRVTGHTIKSGKKVCLMEILADDFKQ